MVNFDNDVREEKTMTGQGLSKLSKKGLTVPHSLINLIYCIVQQFPFPNFCCVSNLKGPSESVNYRLVKPEDSPCL